MDDLPTTEVPVNIASISDQHEIETVVFEIEQLLRHFGASRNLKSIPIVVTDTLTGDGRCVLSAENNAILINKSLFSYEDLDPQLQQISRLWSVILHEIGHCYFYREHEDKHIFASHGHVFQFKNKLKIQNDYQCFYTSRNLWPATVMGKNGISVTPESLKEFYVKELIGHLAHPTQADLLKYQEVSLTDETAVLDDSEPISCHDL